MKIGVPKEIKTQENRIGLTPESVKSLISNGHEVLIENNGGFEAGFDNDQYKSAGAKIVEKADDRCPPRQQYIKGFHFLSLAKSTLSRCWAVFLAIRAAPILRALNRLSCL